MALQQFLPHPFDKPFEYPMTVLFYTLMSLWVENALKVQQAHQNIQTAEQSKRIENMTKLILKQSENIQKILSDSRSRDIVVEKLVTAVDNTADEILNIVKGGDSRDNQDPEETPANP